MLVNVLRSCGLSVRSNTKRQECQAPPTKLQDPRGLDIKLRASYNNTESPTHFDLDCACESYGHN
jgi:hypothetical protein